MTSPTPSPCRRPIAGIVLLLSIALAAPTVVTARQETATAPAAASEGVGDPATPAQAQSFLGYWVLTLKLGEQPTEMGLEIDTLGNEVTGRLVTPFGPMEAEDFRRVGDALAFDLTSNFGNFAVETRIEGQTLLGEFSDEGGSIQSEFRGERSDRSAFERFLVPPNEARITRGDQMIRLRFATPPAEGRDFAQLEALAPGQVVELLEHAVIKLKTDLELRFGELTVPTGNVAPGYAGVYGLWLKRTAAGWSLVFNHDADVWGTQHDPSRDLGEVALEVGTAEQPSERMHGELEETEGGAVLRLRWGPHVFSAPFEIVAAP